MGWQRSRGGGGITVEREGNDKMTKVEPKQQTNKKKILKREGEDARCKLGVDEA